MPHSGQNFPLAVAPHCGQFQLSAAGFGSGFLLPQFGQNFPVIPQMCIRDSIGSSQGGVLGSLLATLGVVLPSFVIILLIAAVLSNLLKYAGVPVSYTHLDVYKRQVKDFRLLHDL